MSLHYSNGSSKKSIGTLAASISSSKKNIKELYYSNGSSKIPIWLGGSGSWDFFGYASSSTEYNIYVINSKTGRSRYITTSTRVPTQTYQDGFATSYRYTEVYFYNNNYVLQRTAATGSFDNIWSVSKKSNFYVTIHNESNSVGKNTYYAYNFTTDASITSVGAMFGISVMWNSDKIMVGAGGTSSGSTNFEQPYSVGGPGYTGGRLASSFQDFVTLPHNYGVVMYRDGVNAVTNDSYLEIIKMNTAGTAYESKFAKTIGGSIYQVVPMDDSVLVFHQDVVTPPPGVSASWYYNLFLTKIKYDGYVIEADKLNIESIIGLNNPAPHRRLDYICTGPSLFTGFNNGTKTFETFSISGTTIKFVSSVTIDNTNINSTINFALNAGYVGQFY